MYILCSRQKRCRVRCWIYWMLGTGFWPHFTVFCSFFSPSSSSSSKFLLVSFDWFTVDSFDGTKRHKISLEFLFLLNTVPRCWCCCCCFHWYFVFLAHINSLAHTFHGIYFYNAPRTAYRKFKSTTRALSPSLNDLFLCVQSTPTQLQIHAIKPNEQKPNQK